ncbi:hypothetical protein CRX72_12210 [Pantoea sp. BRM17]|nr:hypothetical protein CRX72_12210 [Pantoea sp. BRM17]
MSVNSGAYIAEITRGAVLSINKGFREAGLALGLSRRETLRYVIMPLALRRMLPPLGNQWIVSIKDTSLLLIIGLVAGFARAYGGWITNNVALVFIELIRGTPIVVQVMFIYFALPMAFPDLRIDPFTAAVVTIMM